MRAIENTIASVSLEIDRTSVLNLDSTQLCRGRRMFYALYD